MAIVQSGLLSTHEKLQRVGEILTKEALVFLGLAVQAIAVFWMWRDWQMSQYLHPDWRDEHRAHEKRTINELDKLWLRFAGSKDSACIDWRNLSAEQVEIMSKEFPASGDDEALKARKIGILTGRYGLGPSDAEFERIQTRLEHLLVCKNGVGAYRSFIRRQTFRTALTLILVGFALQMWGSWPTHWLLNSDEP